MTTRQPVLVTGGAGLIGSHIVDGALAAGWWVFFYAPATDSAYVVASKPLPEYLVVTRRSYSSWLPQHPTNLYLLRRQDQPWPLEPVPRLIETRPGPDSGVAVPSGHPRWLPVPTTPPHGSRTGAHAGDA